MSSQLKEILTINEIAAYLKIDKHTKYFLAYGENYPTFKLHNTWHFRRFDLDQCIPIRIGMATVSYDKETE